MVNASGCVNWDRCKASTDREACDGHGQKLYADTYERLMLLAIVHLTGNLGAFVEYLVEEELVSRTDRTILKGCELLQMGKSN